MTDQSPMRNMVLVVAYDGTDFHGFAESGQVRTVMGELRAALERMSRVPLGLTAAGRTDAGVHGWGQVVTGLIPEDMDLDRIQNGVNGMCGPEIAVRSAAWADDHFDARFSATSRSYRYDVWNDTAPNPSLARTTWHVRHRLDLDAMNAAAAHLLGEHDFASFCRRVKVAEGDREKSTVRILEHAAWHRVGLDGIAPTETSPLVRFEIRATSFCHQMVRSIVGTLVEVGMGKRSVDSLPASLAALHRNAAGKVAPPTGLTLWHVGYDGARWDAGR
jgi:tRNA pseudouridine38-40 synthase